MISGLPDIDVDDWERNTEYSSGYEEDIPVIRVKHTIFCLYNTYVSLCHDQFYDVCNYAMTNYFIFPFILFYNNCYFCRSGSGR